MAVHITSLQEQRIEDLAVRSGRSPDDFTRELLDRFLDYEENYVAAVREGIAEADRGELIDHADVMATLDRILKHG